jgi:hypothetical protein
MNKKTVFSSLAALAVLGLGAGVDALNTAPMPVGLARSASNFEISRPDVMNDAQRASQALLKTGDEVITQDSIVRVQTRRGESVLIGKTSRVAFPEESSVRLVNGDLAASTPNDGTLIVHADSLSLQHVGEAAEGKQGSVTVSYPEPNRMLVTSYDRATAVSSDVEGNQVAVVGAGDSLRLVRNSLGKWAPSISPSMLQGEGAVPEAPAGGHEESDRRKGFWLFSTPVLVGAGAIVGGVVVYDQVVKDEDKNSGGRRSQDSPVMPDYDDDYNPDDGHEGSS